MKVHKGDTVLVVSGKDKGAKGKVLRAFPTRNRILVEGVNRIKKHTAVSANERGAQSGGIVATPKTAPELYHNARSFEARGESAAARRDYLAFAALGTDHLDPLLRLAALIRKHLGV